jgi:hypothetical protein
MGIIAKFRDMDAAQTRIARSTPKPEGARTLADAMLAYRRTHGDRAFLHAATNSRSFRASRARAAARATANKAAAKAIATKRTTKSKAPQKSAVKTRTVKNPQAPKSKESKRTFNQQYRDHLCIRTKYGEDWARLASQHGWTAKQVGSIVAGASSIAARERRKKERRQTAGRVPGERRGRRR